MKQRITAEQLQELTEEQKQTLMDWWEPQIGDITTGKSSACGVVLEPEKVTKKNDLPLLSIGQMIEIVGDLIEKDNRKYAHILLELNRSVLWIGNAELCDALWESVKQVL